MATQMTMHPAAKNKKCGLIPQPYDPRDYKDPDEPALLLRTTSAPALPAVVSLRDSMPPAIEQGEHGTCTADAMANLLRFKLGTTEMPSRLYMYYIARVFMDRREPSDDSGTTMRSMCNAVRRYLVCDESLHNYNANLFNMPPRAAFNGPKMLNGLRFFPASKAEVAVKRALLARDPILCGVKLYSSFMTEEVGRTGMVPMPDTSVDTVVGGHAMLITGYDSTRKLVETLNSWGTDWGQNGYCYFPLEYFNAGDLFLDMWRVVIS